MGHAYAPTAVPLVTVPCPDDGDARNAASVNAAFEELGDGIFALFAKRDVVITDGAVFTVPAGVTMVRVKLRASGGGGGGGGRGNSANSDTVRSAGAAGGGAGELRIVDLPVTPAETLTYSRGTAGAGGLGSATVDGAPGDPGTDATITASVSGTVITAKGGLGGGPSVRNIDPGQIGGSVGGRSGNFSIAQPTFIDDQTPATANEALGVIAYATARLGPGAGNGTESAAVAKFPTEDGTTFSTDGAYGADDPDPLGKWGGGGGGGGGCALVAGGAGGAGGDAVAGGAGGAGSAGTAAAADSGAGGGGGGSGGTGTAGGVGADGGAGALGYVIFEYRGPQAVIA